MEKEKEKRRTTSCGCFIVRRGESGRKEVLLVKPFASRDNWGVPKGHVDPGESYLDCAIREVWEETGLTPQVLEDVELPTCTARSHDEIKTVRIFMAVMKEPQEIAGDGENAEIAWFDIDSLPTIHRYQADVVAAASELARSIEFD